MNTNSPCYRPAAEAVPSRVQVGIARTSAATWHKRVDRYYRLDDLLT